MRIACLADTHGYLPEAPDADLLIIAGDITPLTPVDEHERWLNQYFGPWLNGMPPSVVICGNHDFIGQNLDGDSVLRHLPCVYLRDEAVVVNGIKIWGTPWTPPFFDWAFMADEVRLGAYFSLIPEDTELLITHGPPRGILDPGYQDPHVGSTALLERVQNLPNLRLHVFGHLHEGHGVEVRGQTTFVNAAYLNDRYKPYPDPITIIDL